MGTFINTKSCFTFIAVIAVLLALVANFLLSSQTINLSDIDEQQNYDCGSTTSKKLWQVGNNFSDSMKEKEFTSTVSYYKGAFTKAFNPIGSYGVFSNHVVQRWFLYMFPNKFRHSLTVFEENSAQVLFFCKPNVKYFGFDIYNMVRWTERPVDIIGASISQPMNILNMNFDSNGMGVIIVSADLNTYEILEKELIKKGVSKNAINFYALSSDLLRFYDPKLGFYKSRPDIIQPVLRYALPNDPEDFSNNFLTTKWPSYWFVPPQSQERKPFYKKELKEEEMYAPGGLEVIKIPDQPSELHLKEKFDLAIKELKHFVSKEFSGNFIYQDDSDVVKNYPHECITNSTFDTSTPGTSKLFGKLARCARITLDSSIVHTYPQQRHIDHDMVYKPDYLFAIISPKHSDLLNLIYSNLCVMVLRHTTKKPQLTYEEKRSLVEWLDVEYSDSGKKYLGEEFEDFYVVFVAQNCPKSLGNYCKTPKHFYPDGVLMHVERLYVNQETGFGPRLDHILPGKMLKFEIPL